MKVIIFAATLAASPALAGPLQQREQTETYNFPSGAGYGILQTTVQLGTTSGKPFNNWWGNHGPGGWIPPWWKYTNSAVVALATTTPNLVLTTATTQNTVTIFKPAPTTTQPSSTAQSTNAASATTTRQTSSTTQVTSTGFVTTPSTTSISTQTSSTTTASNQSASATSTQTDPNANATWQGDQPLNMSYAEPILDAHNDHRANHSVVPLVWNATMEATAKQIADTCVYAHSKAAGDGDYGQNIGAGLRGENVNYLITETFYNDEIELYPGPYGSEPSNTTLFEKWGHYTQLIWAATTSVGCYTTNCTEHGLVNILPSQNIAPYFTVCNYFPPGNVLNAFGKEVHRPGNLKMISIPKPF